MSNLAKAADLAIHYFQLSSTSAINFVEREVPSASRGEVIAALVDSMTFHKKPSKK